MNKNQILIRKYQYTETKVNKIIPDHWCNKCHHLFKRIHIFTPVGGRFNKMDNLDLCDTCKEDTFEIETPNDKE